MIDSNDISLRNEFVTNASQYYCRFQTRRYAALILHGTEISFFGNDDLDICVIKDDHQKTSRHWQTIPPKKYCWTHIKNVEIR
ncbi:MAG: hypothetical protein LBS50_02995 [Prevotellaceae bacterium]|nr:hypothetical protein [Prevotellaceae bacterium]